MGSGQGDGHWNWRNPNPYTARAAIAAITQRFGRETCGWPLARAWPIARPATNRSCQASRLKEPVLIG